MSDAEAPAGAQLLDTKRFNGPYTLRRSDQHMPYRHPSFDGAEKEAHRLLGKHPEATFVISQECARVKLKPLPGGDPYPLARDWLRRWKAFGPEHSVSRELSRPRGPMGKRHAYVTFQTGTEELSDAEDAMMGEVTGRLEAELLWLIADEEKSNG